mmetsp:Transcript_10490/g.30870  ORF Transcript_10490/g.30870 Transcript_10490/m.30870 type:complete len:242 (-) Transcript_10490:12-737(-)
MPRDVDTMQTVFSHTYKDIFDYSFGEKSLSSLQRFARMLRRFRRQNFAHRTILYAHEGAKLVLVSRRPGHTDRPDDVPALLIPNENTPGERRHVSARGGDLIETPGERVRGRGVALLVLQIFNPVRSGGLLRGNARVGLGARYFGEQHGGTVVHPLGDDFEARRIEDAHADGFEGVALGRPDRHGGDLVGHRQAQPLRHNERHLDKRGGSGVERRQRWSVGRRVRTLMRALPFKDPMTNKH